MVEAHHSETDEVVLVSLAQGIEGLRLPSAVSRSTAAETGAALAVCPLDPMAGPHVRVLHRRPPSGGRCALDHVVVGRAAVFVVGVESCPGDPIETQVVGGMIAPERTELMARGRIVNGLLDQVAVGTKEIAAVLADDGRGEVDVVPLLWLAGASMPLLHRRLVVDEVAVVGSGRLHRTLARRGPLDDLTRYRISCLLGERFPGLV